MLFYALIPGIQALIHRYYIDVSLSAGVLIILLLIYLLKKILKDFSQLLTTLIMLAFNLSFFFLDSGDFHKLPENIAFLRGYGFAGIQITLLGSFSYFGLKVLALLLSYVMRFVVMAYLQPNTIDAYTIMCHVFIDVFVLFMAYFSEKRERECFKDSYKSREELAKFKKFLVEYLPQSVLVLRRSDSQPLFSNKAYGDIFLQPESPSSDGDSVSNQFLLNSETKKPHLNRLRIDKNTIREAGTLHPNKSYSVTSNYLSDLISELGRDKTLEQKALSLSASCSLLGQERFFEVLLTNIDWQNEEAVVTILSDTTYQEKLTALKVSNTNKDQVIATVSHELRTPLNGIIGILQIAEKKVETEEVLGLLGLCRDNAHLLMSLVNSLLDLQQIKRGKLRLNPVKIELYKLLQGVMKLFHFQCLQKRISLNLKIEDNVPTHIWTDEDRLKQILINLVGNALKFTTNGGITLGVAQHPEQGGFLNISVSDTGIGIKEEDQNRLFKMYGKLEDKESVNTNGVGLGLMISNTLAGILSGRKNERVIQVASKPGEGTKFWFQISKNILNIIEDVNQTFSPKKLRIDLKNSILMDCNNKGEDKDSNDEIPSETFVKINTTNTLHSKMMGYTPQRPKTILELSSSAYMQKGYSNTGLINDSFKRYPDFDDDKLVSVSRKAGSFISSLDAISPEKIKPRSCRLANPESPRACILVVDDNAFNLLVAEGIIKELNFSFIKAQSGHEAISILKSNQSELEMLELILMDCQMPIMDGFETTEIISDLMDRGEIRKVPIVALTANNSDEDIKRCYESGMVGHLSKPLFPAALLKVLAEQTLYSDV